MAYSYNVPPEVDRNIDSIKRRIWRKGEERKILKNKIIKLQEHDLFSLQRKWNHVMMSTGRWRVAYNARKSSKKDREKCEKAIKKLRLHFAELKSSKKDYSKKLKKNREKTQFLEFRLMQWELYRTLFVNPDL